MPFVRGFAMQETFVHENGDGEADPLDGWLPIGVDLNSAQGRVEWAYFGKGLLTEPFFKQSVERLESKSPRPRRKVTGLEDLQRIPNAAPPRGFIFHVSRCGSTLVSNSMREFTGMSVIAEAPIFGPLLMKCLMDARNGLGDDGQIGTYELLKGVMAAFGRPRNGVETGMIVKFSSWQILALGTVRKLWPEVPCVIVIRDPVEVLVSCLRKPPGWMSFQNDGQAARTLFPWLPRDLSSISREQFGARAIADYLESAATNAGPLCRIVDYADISNRRILDIGRQFSLVGSEADQTRIAACLTTYSKDPDGRQSFKDDRQEKQLAGSGLIRAEVERWTSERYRSLARLARNW